MIGMFPKERYMKHVLAQVLSAVQHVATLRSKPEAGEVL